jgi:hypothetical protein
MPTCKAIGYQQNCRNDLVNNFSDFKSRKNIVKKEYQMTKCKKSKASEIKEWLAVRKKAATKINAKTAEVDWIYAQTMDPYGVIPNIPVEHQQVGREYLARAPGSDVWVWFGDLPRKVHDALWKKHKSKLAFPAGLSSGIFNA